MGIIEAAGAERVAAAVALCLAQLCFTLWCLRQRRGLTQLGGVSAHQTEGLLIAYASQTGFAQQLATQTAQSLQDSAAVRLASLAEIEAHELATSRQALFVVSTTGEGDAPDDAAGFVRKALGQALDLSRLRYGLLALGDREYDNFCAFGHRLDAWLRRQGATPMFDVVEVNNGDAGALRHWQHQLGVLSGRTDLPDWHIPGYQPWQLNQRELLNPGSLGEPCYHLELRPPPGSEHHWQAGDIAEIDPQNSTLQAGTPGLAHREYSIASLPADGSLHLLVRRMRRDDGSSGLASGWLTEGAQIGGTVGLRIRTNANFHAPRDQRPVILIGNGTGIAALRALLKARMHLGARRNWLIFGERSAAVDSFYRVDIDRWRQQGWIEELDLVFSRDQLERRYVQHRLLERAGTMRAWLAAGAAIYVCGSLQGMAPGVHAALLEIVGADMLERLSTEGRYRRDVY